MGISRRGLLAGAAVGAASLAFPALERRPKAPGPSLRVAFLTDIHLDQDPACVRGLTRALQRTRSLDDRPDFVIQGGDLIMDGLVRDARSVNAQYDLARDVLAKNCDLPIEHVIGNHDVWGWERADTAQISSDPLFGKGWWMRWTGYRSSYRSFDRGGWHFVLLDSIQPARRGYVAVLDAQQKAWLQNDLAQVSSDTPVCIVSHVPILSTAAMFFGPAERSGYWHISGSLMHIDARWIKDLLLKHPNVKACVSGHIHMCDRVDYNGVRHFGVGAVCGAWWKGRMQETPPGFGMLDFYANGHVHHTYVAC